MHSCFHVPFIQTWDLQNWCLFPKLAMYCDVKQHGPYVSHAHTTMTCIHNDLPLDYEYQASHWFPLVGKHNWWRCHVTALIRPLIEQFWAHGSGQVPGSPAPWVSTSQINRNERKPPLLADTWVAGGPWPPRFTAVSAPLSRVTFSPLFFWGRLAGKIHSTRSKAKVSPACSTSPERARSSLEGNNNVTC